MTNPLKLLVYAPNAAFVMPYFVREFADFEVSDSLDCEFDKAVNPNYGISFPIL